MAEVMERRTALCRGCESVLKELDSQLWEDEDGFTVCIKSKFGRPPIPHMPLPEGFRGGPE